MRVVSESRLLYGVAFAGNYTFVDIKLTSCFEEHFLLLKKSAWLLQQNNKSRGAVPGEKKHDTVANHLA